MKFRDIIFADKIFGFAIPNEKSIYNISNDIIDFVKNIQRVSDVECAPVGHVRLNGSDIGVFFVDSVSGISVNIINKFADKNNIAAIYSNSVGDGVSDVVVHSKGKTHRINFSIDAKINMIPDAICDYCGDINMWSSDDCGQLIEYKCENIECEMHEQVLFATK